jgi:hypothetical protein
MRGRDFTTQRCLLPPLCGRHGAAARRAGILYSSRGRRHLGSTPKSAPSRPTAPRACSPGVWVRLPPRSRASPLPAARLGCQLTSCCTLRAENRNFQLPRARATVASQSPTDDQSVPPMLPADRAPQGPRALTLPPTRPG